MRRKANGEEIRRRRKRQGLTQEKVAEAAELNVRTIRRAEEGKRMSARTLDRIAQALGAQAEALVYLERAVEAPSRSERSTGGSTPAYGLPSTAVEMVARWADIRRSLGLDHFEELYRRHMEPLRHIQELYAKLPAALEAQRLAESFVEPKVIQMQREYDPLRLVAPLLEEQRRLAELCSVPNLIGNVRLA
jgi:transcriptional regulator with XRE-family HTH domain